MQTLKSRVIVLVRSLPQSIKRQPEELVFASTSEFGNVDLVRDDVVFNVITSETALKRKGDGTPWRGPKEKSDSLLQLLVTALCPSDGVIVDLTAGSGELIMTTIITLLLLMFITHFTHKFYLIQEPRFELLVLLQGTLLHLRVTPPSSKRSSNRFSSFLHFQFLMLLITPKA